MRGKEHLGEEDTYINKLIEYYALESLKCNASTIQVLITNYYTNNYLKK